MKKKVIKEKKGKSDKIIKKKKDNKDSKKDSIEASAKNINKMQSTDDNEKSGWWSEK